MSMNTMTQRNTKELHEQKKVLSQPCYSVTAEEIVVGNKTRIIRLDILCSECELIKLYYVVVVN